MKYKKTLPIVVLGLIFTACSEGEQTNLNSGKTAEEVEMVEEEIFPPKLLEPENNATVFEEKPLFKWTEVPGDQLYQIEIHQFEEMEAPAWSDYPSDYSWRIEEKFMGLAHGETYYWRVKRGSSGWSEVYSFTVDLKK